MLCQDAFYFLEPKDEILARLRGLVADGGRLLVGHVHNREAANYSAGRAVTAQDIAAQFPEGVVYDDAELTRALVEARAPVPRAPAELRRAEAFAVASGGTPRGLAAGYALPPEDAACRVNPALRRRRTAADPLPLGALRRRIRCARHLPADLLRTRRHRLS